MALLRSNVISDPFFPSDEVLHIPDQSRLSPPSIVHHAFIY